jgi:hypothetical protein
VKAQTLKTAAGKVHPSILPGRKNAMDVMMPIVYEVRQMVRSTRSSLGSAAPMLDLSC